MAKPPEPAFLRHRKTPAFIAIAYIGVLVVPWVLTCILSSRTVRQSRDNSGVLEPELGRTLHRVSILIDVLHFIAAIAAVPVIYALLARAAVVFAQRTNSSKTLNARQLFALADRQFLRQSLPDGGGPRTSLALVGSALILLSLILPPIRAILVYSKAVLFPEAHPSTLSALNYANGWNGALVGLDPTIYGIRAMPGFLAARKTRHGLITTLTTEWKAAAWYDPDSEDSGRYFASSLPRDTTTGMYRQHALRLNSSSSCRNILPSEFPAPCPGLDTRGLEASYENANLTVKVCVPGTASRNAKPWNATDRSPRQDLTETMYINLSDPVPKKSPRYPSHTFLCTATTSMGYFELGNSFNGGKFGPLLSSFQYSSYGKPPGEFTDGETSTRILPHHDELPVGVDWGVLAYDSNSDAPASPLAIAAHGLFGPDSFFDLAQGIEQHDDPLSLALCRLSPIPFQRVFADLPRCDVRVSNPRYSTPDEGVTGTYDGWANDRVYALVQNILLSADKVDGPLNTALYLANKATLDSALTRNDDGRYYNLPNQIWRADGIEVRTPVVSKAALVVVSVLLALQVGGVLALVGYIYSAPTWTNTLDAMAVARIAAHLTERHGALLRSDGLWDPSKEQLRRMETEDALVGALEGEPLDSRVDKGPSSRISDAGAGAEESPAVGYVLSVGAPGLISRQLKNINKSSV